MIAINRAVRLGLFIAPLTVAAQRPIVLSKPEAEFGEPFSVITGVRELRDGRVIVADGREKRVHLIDFKAGSTRIGREGAGPGEIGQPMAIVALPGDSSAIWDGTNVRYILIHPDGKSGRDFRLDPSGGGSAMMGLSVRPVPRGTDARGNIYFQGSPFRIDAAKGLVPSDTSAVIRYDRAALRLDTIAHIRLAKGTGAVRAQPDGSTQITMGGANPLEPRDEWAVLPDGKVVIVRGADYHLEFVTPGGSRTSGPAIPFERISVTDAVKAMVEEQRERQRRLAIGSGGGRGGAPAGSTAPSAPPLRPLENWPEVMPAFQANAVIARPLGASAQIWVMRVQRPGPADFPQYDVFDTTGKIVARVTLPKLGRLIGFGAGTAYVIRTDEDDLQYLQRFRIP
jgi:hypothetical protein